MQINYVIVVLAGRHVQRREGGGRRKKEKRERSYGLLARGEEEKPRGLAQVLGTYSITAPQSCTGSIISGFQPHPFTHTHTHTPPLT